MIDFFSSIKKSSPFITSCFARFIKSCWRQISLTTIATQFDKFILRANEHGQPKYIEQEVNGITYKAVMVEGKIYIPDNTQVI